MIKFKTQFRKSKEGNIHFAFLGISFNKNQFMIIVLGIVVIINLNQNKMNITKNVTSKINTNKVLLKIRKGKLDRIRKSNKCIYKGEDMIIEQFDCISISLGLFPKYDVLLTFKSE